MSDETRNVKLWYESETEKAIRYCLSRVPKDDDDYVWIPRSLITHRRKFVAMVPDRPEHIVTVAEWFAEKEGL